MSDEQDEIDELSDEAIDAEIARRTAEMLADSDAGAGPVSLGIEGLSGPELDELIASRSGEAEPTSAKVKAVMAANDAATADEDEEVPVAPGTFSSMSDEAFAEFVRKRPGVGGGF
jgi:hypothetical protein